VKIHIPSSKVSFKKKEDKLDNTVENMMDTVETSHPFVDRLHIDWVYRYALYLGYHYYLPDYENHVLYEAVLERDSRSVFNYLRGFVDIYAAKMLKDKPVPQSYPLTYENKAIRCARIRNLLTEQFWREQDMNFKMQYAMIYSASVGSGVIKVHVNKKDGVKVQLGDEVTTTGKVVANVISPWNFYPDPLPDNIDKCRWFIHTYVQPVSVIKRLFPEHEDKIHGEEIQNYKDILEAYSDSKTGDENEGSGAFKEDVVSVKEYWEIGVDGYDAGFGKGKGRYTVRVNKTTLYDGENPFGTRRNFFMFTTSKNPDSLNGDGIIHHTKQMQLDLNRINSLTMENIDWTAMVKIVAPRGCNIQDNAFNKDSGEVLEVDADSQTVPHHLRIEGMPQYVPDFRGFVKQSMMDVSGLHEVNFAQLPQRANATSGKALNALIESESDRFSREIMAIEKEVIELNKFQLYATKKFLGDTYIQDIVGRSHSLDIVEMTAEDIEGEADEFYEVGSGFGLSPSAKSDQLLLFWDRKIITDPNEVLRLSEFGQTGKKYADASLDENKATRHLQMVLSGAMPFISKYDNHQAAIRVVGEFIRSSDFDLITDDRKKLLEAYLDGHYNAMDALALEQEARKVEGSAQLQALQSALAPQPQQPPQQGPNAGQSQPMMMPDETQAAMDEQLSQASGPPQINSEG